MSKKLYVAAGMAGMVFFGNLVFGALQRPGGYRPWSTIVFVLSLLVCLVSVAMAQLSEPQQEAEDPQEMRSARDNEFFVGN